MNCLSISIAGGAGEAFPSDTSPRRSLRSSSALGHAPQNVFKGGAVKEEAIVGTAAALGLGEKCQIVCMSQKAAEWTLT